MSEMNRIAGGSEPPKYDEAPDPGLVSAAAVLYDPEQLLKDKRKDDPEDVSDGLLDIGTVYQRYVEVGFSGPKIG